MRIRTGISWMDGMCASDFVFTGFEPVRSQNIFSGFSPLFAFSATV